MVVKNHEAVTEAQSNQVPPALRKWICSHDVIGAGRIERMSNEISTRGWKVYAISISPRQVPDGFHIGSVELQSGFVYIRED